MVVTTIRNRAVAEVPEFEDLLQRKRSISVLERSELTFKVTLETLPLWHCISEKCPPSLM